MQTFVIRPTIYMENDLGKYLETLELNENDVVLTNEVLLKDIDKSILANATVIFQEKYGKGEPTNIMVDNIIHDTPKGRKRIIGIGGGSIQDISKFLSLNIDGNIEDLLFNDAKYEKAAELILIPTTCGTGSEVTNIAIAEVTSRKTKKGFANDIIFADKAVLIPSCIESLPYFVFATSSIDALVHSVESFLSPKATAISRLFSKEAITIIVSNYRRMMSEGKESWKDSASDFMLASLYGGIAFGNAGCAAVHAMSYPLSGTYHVPHGEANQVMFEAVLRKYEEKDPNSAIRQFKEMLAEIMDVDVNVALDELFNTMNSVLKRKPLIEYGMTEEEIESFSVSVIDSQQRLLVNNCLPLTKEDMIEIYSSIYRK